MNESDLGGRPPALAGRLLSVDGRRQEIVRLLLEREHVTVRELVGRFGVSHMTVHRDLDALQARGVLRKVHGGATASPTSLYESSLAFRLGAHREAKEKVARRAATYVKPGSSLALDDSTTCLAMVPHLARIPQLTVVTGFLSIVEHLGSRVEEETRLILVGGTYNAKYHSVRGALAEQSLRELRLDRCFMSISAIDVTNGLLHQEEAEASLRRAMIEASRERYLLADGSKFEQRALHRVAGLDVFDAVIVDDGTGKDVLRALRRQGVRVQVAP